MERAVLALVILLATSGAFAQSSKKGSTVRKPVSNKDYGNPVSKPTSTKDYGNPVAPTPKRDYGNPENSAVPHPDPNLTIRENAYAPGVGMDQYGRPAVLAPANKGQGGYYGDARIERHDAFGPGVHMDQYGRPVVIVPGTTVPPPGTTAPRR